MRRLKDEMISYITRDEIAEIVLQLAQEIERDYAGKELVLLGVLKGSFLFISDLSRQIKLPQQIDFVQMASFSHESNEPSIRIVKDIGVSVVGKHVLIIEEIIDEGKTLNFLRNRILASAPASLKIVTLLDKPARRVINIKPDYTGRTIEDRYVVGYGMDDGELGRNYPDIYYLRH
jgi:hypoxanthine phosphoribosyltransferase